MTRGRHDNEAFVVVEGEQTALDVLGQALARDWIDQPAVALRAQLGRRVAEGHGRGVTNEPLAPSALRELLERQAAITDTISQAEFGVRHWNRQIDLATEGRVELVARLAEEQARRDGARQVIDEYDHPLQRRFHRGELDRARMTLDQAGHAVVRHTKGLADIDERLPGHRSALQRAEETLRDRPALDRERHVIDRELRRDLGARRAAIAADPPDRFVDWLGPRPERSAGQWDEAAARIDQHRSAFDVTDERSPLGSKAPSWERDAFATSHRDASAALDRLDRNVGRARVLERPGPELSVGR